MHTFVIIVAEFRQSDGVPPNSDNFNVILFGWERALWPHQSNFPLASNWGNSLGRTKRDWYIHDNPHWCRQQQNGNQTHPNAGKTQTEVILSVGKTDSWLYILYYFFYYFFLLFWRLEIVSNVELLVDGLTVSWRLVGQLRCLCAQHTPWSIWMPGVWGTEWTS